MTPKPLVSVIMPVFNGERYLAEAIESVLNQTYRPVELIVVDDGSTDTSVTIATGYRASGIRLLRQPNLGTGAARNAGFDFSSGEMVAHLDADDLWLPHSLDCLVEALSRDSKAEISAGLVEEFVSPDLNAKERSGLRQPRGPLPGRLLLAMLVRRTTHDRIGPFETTWDVGQDLAWLLRARDLDICIAEAPVLLARRRLHAANKGRKRPELARQRCRILKQALDRRRSLTESQDSS